MAAGPAELAVHRLVTVFWWFAIRASSCPPARRFQILRNHAHLWAAEPSMTVPSACAMPDTHSAGLCSPVWT